MLTDEQRAVLPRWVAKRVLIVTGGASERLMIELANTLLARQRLEQKLAGAQIILEEMYDYLPPMAGNLYRRMKHTLQSEEADDANISDES